MKLVVKCFYNKIYIKKLATNEFYNILQILVFLIILFTCPIGQVTVNIHSPKPNFYLSWATGLLLMSSPATLFRLLCVHSCSIKSLRTVLNQSVVITSKRFSVKNMI